MVPIYAANAVSYSQRPLFQIQDLIVLYIERKHMHRINEMTILKYYNNIYYINNKGWC